MRRSIEDYLGFAVPVHGLQASDGGAVRAHFAGLRVLVQAHTALHQASQSARGSEGERMNVVASDASLTLIVLWDVADRILGSFPS